MPFDMAPETTDTALRQELMEFLRDRLRAPKAAPITGHVGPLDSSATAIKGHINTFFKSKGITNAAHKGRLLDPLLSRISHISEEQTTMALGDLRTPFAEAGETARICSTADYMCKTAVDKIAAEVKTGKPPKSLTENSLEQAIKALFGESKEARRTVFNEVIEAIEKTDTQTTDAPAAESERELIKRTLRQTLAKKPFTARIEAEGATEAVASLKNRLLDTIGEHLYSMRDQFNAQTEEQMSSVFERILFSHDQRSALLEKLLPSPKGKSLASESEALLNTLTEHFPHTEDALFGEVKIRLKSHGITISKSLEELRASGLGFALGAEKSTQHAAEVIAEIFDRTGEYGFAKFFTPEHITADFRGKHHETGEILSEAALETRANMRDVMNLFNPDKKTDLTQAVREKLEEAWKGIQKSVEPAREGIGNETRVGTIFSRGSGTGLGLVAQASHVLNPLSKDVMSGSMITKLPWSMLAWVGSYAAVSGLDGIIRGERDPDSRKRELQLDHDIPKALLGAAALAAAVMIGGRGAPGIARSSLRA